MTFTITNSAGIVYLAENAKGRNRSIDNEVFAESVDPEGLHVMVMSFPHNDVEMRTQWLCKMRDLKDPIDVWLDVDLDALNECTTEIEGPKDVENVRRDVENEEG